MGGRVAVGEGVAVWVAVEVLVGVSVTVAVTEGESCGVKVGVKEGAVIRVGVLSGMEVQPTRENNEMTRISTNIVLSK